MIPLNSACQKAEAVQYWFPRFLAAPKAHTSNGLGAVRVSVCTSLFGFLILCSYALLLLAQQGFRLYHTYSMYPMNEYLLGMRGGLSCHNLSVNQDGTFKILKLYAIAQ